MFQLSDAFAQRLDPVGDRVLSLCVEARSPAGSHGPRLVGRVERDGRVSRLAACPARVQSGVRRTRVADSKQAASIDADTLASRIATDTDDRLAVPPPRDLLTDYSADRT